MGVPPQEVDDDGFYDVVDDDDGDGDNQNGGPASGGFADCNNPNKCHPEKA